MLWLYIDIHSLSLIILGNRSLELLPDDENNVKIVIVALGLFSIFRVSLFWVPDTSLSEPMIPAVTFMSAAIFCIYAFFYFIF